MCAHAFSASARKQIEGLGGTCEVINPKAVGRASPITFSSIRPPMFANIVNTFANCFKIPELKSRILFTLLILAICRVVAIIPSARLDGPALKDSSTDKLRRSRDGGLLGMYSMFTGGAMERCAVGALGIMPYISATIIIQLLTAVIPQLSKLAREEGGRTKIIQYGRYLTVLLCLGQGFVMAIGWENPEQIFHGFTGDLVLYRTPFWWYRIQTT